MDSVAVDADVGSPQEALPPPVSLLVVEVRDRTERAEEEEEELPEYEYTLSVA